MAELDNDEIEAIEAIHTEEAERKAELARGRGASAPEGAAFALEAPPFLLCPCGRDSTRVPCWYCVTATAEARRREDLIAEAAKTIPAGFSWATLDALELLDERVHVLTRGKRASVVSVAQAVLAYPGSVVLFRGPSELGKTSLAVACMRTVPGAMYVHAIELERAQIEHPAGHGKPPLVKRALRVPLLLLDDLGQDEDMKISPVKAILLQRHAAALPTWVTTGLEDRQLEPGYGAGDARRLTHDATALRVNFGRPGEDGVVAQVLPPAREPDYDPRRRASGDVS